jgi:hypothetical protein
MLPLALLLGAPLLVISCEREPLDPSEVGLIPVGDAGPVTTPTSSPDGAVELTGIWSGELRVSAPGFDWGPLDGFTIRLNADGSLATLQFASSFPPPHTFGSQPADFPLQGSRDAPFTPGSVYTVQVTVETADFESDRFHLRTRIVSTGATPSTDYVEDVSGQLVGGAIDVTYAATGTLLIVPISALASGELRPD